MRVEVNKLKPGNHLQQRCRIDCPAKFLHVARHMICHPFMIVVAEYYFNVSIVDKPVDQAGGEFNVVAHVMVVKSFRRCGYCREV